MDNVIYWDASAVLSCLFKDIHSEEAQNKASVTGFHVISSLAYSEICAVIARLQRDKQIRDVFVTAAFDTLANGPWRNLILQPEINIMQNLATRWPLRGADLWHLTCALTLQKQLPELTLLTYDNRLKIAAEEEGL
ncbi:MAG: type II toxin-antitoxin system VapC family toxin [Firmicutes bacterium]|nr:type II toxin-antitoxin system VapC family toxin [Bacillota bacterium]